MSLVCNPDTSIPMPSKAPPIGLREGVDAACETLKVLQDEGLEVVLNGTEFDAVSKVVEDFAASYDQTKPPSAPPVVSNLPPSALILVKEILDKYSHAVVEHSIQIRHLVTNKLLLDSDNNDAKIRIKALELLGKISDVGLFTERSEVVVTHQSSNDLQDKLRAKLQKLMGTEEVEDVVELDGEPIDVDKELGLE
jgi:F0F1-type ATP synthase delta subunit